MKGFIRKRGDTFTVYWHTVDPATGRRVQQSKGGFPTKEPSRKPKGDSAREHLNSIIGSVQDGTWRPDKALTVTQLLEDHWLPARRSEGLRASTLSQYGHVVKDWLVPNLGAVKVASLTPGHIDDLKGSMSHLSPRSRQLALTVLKGACQWALANGMLVRNPLVGVKRGRADRKPTKWWTKEEAQQFLAATAGSRYEWVWALLLARGLRRGELCGLRWDAIDLERQTLRIVRTRVVVDGLPFDSITKTKSGVREIPLDDDLVSILKPHKTRQGRERWDAQGAYQDMGYLLANQLGVPVHPDTLSGWLDKEIHKAGLPRIRLHDLRHTAASLMLADGWPVKMVSEILGHSSGTITIDLYQHVMPGMAKKAGAALSASLFGAGSK
jgi:integrase